MALAVRSKHSRRPAPHCRRCTGYRSAKTVCCSDRAIHGDKAYPRKVDILFVGMAPGNDEDHAGTCFVGRSGKLFDAFVHSYCDEYDCELTNALRCYLGYQPNHEAVKPKAIQMKACRTFLSRTIEELRPDLIVPMGQYAIAQVLGVPVNNVKLGKVLCFPMRSEWGCEVFPIHHPAWVLRTGVDREGNGPGIDRWEREWEALAMFLRGEKPEFPGEYEYVQSRETIEAHYAAVKNHERVAFDYETTGLDAWKDEFRMVGVASSGETAFVHPLVEDWQREIHAEFLRVQKNYVIHNFSFELVWSKLKVGLRPQGLITDTKVLSFLGNENSSHALGDLIDEYVPELSGFKRKTDAVGVQFASDELTAERCAYDCMGTYTLAERLEALVLSEKQNEFYRQKIEPGLKTITNMRIRGWKVDLVKAQENLDAAELWLDELRKKAVAIPEVKEFEAELNAGKKKFKPLNLNSSKDVPDLFKYLGIDDGEDRQPNDPSRIRTAAGVLSRYKDKHPVVPLILEYKDLIHTRSMFLRPLITAAAEDGYIHPYYNWGGKDTGEKAGGTGTGRLSCSKGGNSINVLNLPRSDEQANEFVQQVRPCIVSRFIGGSIGSADYSQLELRLMAMLANEETLLKAFREGKDPHQETADLMGVPRVVAKTLNFGTGYGASPQRIAQEAGCSLKKATKLWIGFWETKPNLRRWMGSIKRKAISQGYLEGPWGMRCHCPDARSDNFKTVNHAMRRVGNWLIQHIGAILTYEAMWRMDQYLTENREYQSLLIGQEHDKLYLDIHPEDCEEDLGLVLEDIMVNDMTRQYDWLTVPLEIDFKVSATM